MRIFLVGLTGSGKTTLGKQLSLHLRIPFVDLDDYIIKKEKRTIAAIFGESGEEYFRQAEADSLREVCKMKEAVISTGGGAACFHENMAVMNAAGITLFLDVPIHEITERLWNQPNRENRPMIASRTFEELTQFLHSLYERRLSFYSEAKITLSGKAITLAQILAELDAMD